MHAPHLLNTPEDLGRARRRGQVALVLADLGIAASWPLGAVAVRDAPPLAIAAARYLVALLPALVLLGMRGAFWPRDRNDRLLLLIMGLGMAAYNVVYLAGLSGSPPTYGALVVCASMPLFATGGARILLKEALRRSQIAGLSLGCLGITVLALTGGAAVSPVAAVPFLVGGFIWAGQTVASRVVLRRVSATHATAWSIAFGCAVLAPAAVLQLGPSRLIEAAPAAATFGILLGLLSTLMPLAMTMLALPILGVAATSSSFLLIPVLAIILSVGLLGSPLSAGQLAGGALALLGVGLTLRSAG